MIGDPVAGKAREWDDPEIADFALEGQLRHETASSCTGFQLFRDIVVDTPRSAWKRSAAPSPRPPCDVSRRKLGEAARIGETIMLEGKEYPFRPAAVNYYRGAIAHKDGGQDSMALKMLNTLLGNIDMPGGHLGVPLDIRGFFIEPGEHGMLKPNPHILHPPVVQFPADSLQMMEWFPLGMDAGHIAVDAVLNPEKYRLEYVPEVLLTYHSNPVWNMPAHEKVLRAMATFKYVISIDVVINETTEWADLILPDHTYLESTLAVSCESPVVKKRLVVAAAGRPAHSQHAGRGAENPLIGIARTIAQVPGTSGTAS